MSIEVGHDITLPSKTGSVPAEKGKVDVSVCLITYNHANYITEAIESILMQEVDFSWEIVIADDYSTDKTREIIERYFQKYPEKIKPLLQKQNVGAGRNFVNLLEAARGKYIAYIEGDDFWTDPFKLARQFEFMESHPDFSLCYHQINWTHTYATNEDPNIRSNETDPDISTIKDLFERGWFIRSCSMFFKNIALPPQFENLYIGDYPLHLLLADKGKLGLIKKCMGTYRINDAGFSHNNLITYDIIKRKKNVRSEIEMYKYIDKHTAYKYHSQFRQKLFERAHSHLIFIRKHSNKELLPELFFLIKAIGFIKLMQGLVGKIRIRLNKKRRVD